MWLVLALLLAPCAAPTAPRCHAAPPCTCRGDTLACSHDNTYTLPETEPHIAHVSVWGARLGVLGEAALGGRRLRTLVLGGSHLHLLEPRCLLSMASTLASLDLGYNEFTEVPIGPLRDLEVLNWLNLQNNHISDLDPETDWGPLGDSLSTLSLNNNELQVLAGSALAGLRRLARLELEGNRLRHVHPAALPPALASLIIAGNLLPAPPCVPGERLRLLAIRDNMLHHTETDGMRCHARHLDTLDLSYNQLDDVNLPAALKYFTTRHLVLDLNDLTHISVPVYENSRLEKLSISHNRLSSVSDTAVHGLKRDLERLELDHNDLEALPDTLSELRKLRHLSVAYNRLVEVKQLPPRLHELSLAGNYLEELPASLGGLEAGALRRLDVGYNRITELHASQFTAWASELGALDLRGNPLAALDTQSLPPNLPLRELLLGFTELSHVHAHALSSLPVLRVLQLSSTMFNGEFPPATALAGLEWLSLDNNNVHFVTSDDFRNFSSLEFLNLEFNKIVEFPTEYRPEQATYRLKELRLAYNYVSRIVPEFISEMRELQSVDLSYNRLRNLSERSFADLPRLVHLSLAGNELVALSARALIALPRLAALHLQENALAELSLASFRHVGDAEAGLALNASHNRIASLVGGGERLAISLLDLSHNLLDGTTRTFFESIRPHLRQLVLSHNRLIRLNEDSFGVLPALESMTLAHNNISVIRRHALLAPTLLALDLSHNSLSSLEHSLLDDTPSLRHLSLAGNLLRTLPRDLGAAPLEHVDLRDNRLAVFPGGALAGAGHSLRRLELAHNRLEHLDAAMFRALPHLRELSLARNALTVLPDNTFAALARLRALDLSHNAIKTNFKELFHNLPELRRLALAGAGLRAVPRLPLANLTELDLSDNRITLVRDVDVRRLAALRVLGLARNELVALRGSAWAALPRLVALDVSGNPLALLPRGALDGLGRLLRLRAAHLRQLEALDPRVAAPLLALRALELDVPAGGALPGALLAAVPHVQALSLLVSAPALDEQLRGLRAPKLRVVEVRGAGLRRVAADALAPLGGARALALRVSGTALAALPAGLLGGLARVAHLALDLRDNRLRALAPHVLYGGNASAWARRGTRLLPGGLALGGNELRCGCAAAWLGGWLRRWAAECGGGAAAAAGGAWCRGAGGGARRLLALQPDAAECGAEALSSAAPPALAPAPRSTPVSALVLVFLFALS